MGKNAEFFEDKDGRRSMTRLLMFLSFFFTSYVVYKCADKPNIDEVLSWYISGYVLGYIGGKGADVLMANRSDSIVEQSSSTKRVEHTTKKD